MLQIVAWSNMIVEYSSNDGLIEGAKKTFDGAHPCCLCKAIASGKKEESKDQKLPTSNGSTELLAKAFVASEDTTTLILTSTDLTHIPTAEFLAHWTGRGESPPAPPPRSIESEA